MITCHPQAQSLWTHQCNIIMGKNTEPFCWMDRLIAINMFHMIRLAWLYFSVALCTLLQYFSSKIQIRGLKMKVSYSVIYLLTFLWNIIFCIKYSHFLATLRAENLFENLYIEMMFALFQTYCSNQIAHYEVIWQLGSWLRRELPFLSFAERERDRKRRLLTVALEFRYSCSVLSWTTSNSFLVGWVPVSL